MVLGGGQNKTLKNCNLLPNFLKLKKFRVIVQNDELHKTLGYFLSGVIPFKHKSTARESMYYISHLDENSISLFCTS